MFFMKKRNKNKKKKLSRKEKREIKQREEAAAATKEEEEEGLCIEGEEKKDSVAAKSCENQTIATAKPEEQIRDEWFRLNTWMDNGVQWEWQKLFQPKQRVEFHEQQQRKEEGLMPWMFFIGILLVALFALIWILKRIFWNPCRRRRNRHFLYQDQVRNAIRSNSFSPDLTPHQVFEHLWPTISQSSYRHLLLPPQCQRVVDKQLLRRYKQQQNEEKIKQRSTIKQDDTDDEDEEEEDDDEVNPIKRFNLYARHFGNLVRTVLSHDFMGAGRMLMDWIHTLIRFRQSRKTRPSEEDDDDDDEEYEVVQHEPLPHSITTTQQHATAAAAESTIDMTETTGNESVPLDENAENNNKPIQRSSTTATAAPKRDWNTHAPPEEKKDEESRRLNNASFVSTVECYDDFILNDDDFQSIILQDDDNEDPCENDVNPQQMTRTPLSSQRQNDNTAAQYPTTVNTTTRKKKDALQNYRSTNTKSTPANTSFQPQTNSKRTISPIPFDTPLTVPVASSTSTPAVPPQPPPRKNSSDTLSFFDAAHSRASLKRMHVEVPVPDRNGYILGDEFLSRKHTPLLVFVNSTSGPQQGHLLIAQFRRLLNPIQVWDLADGPPEPILESFTKMSRVRILVCGGDGTVSWIISAIEKLRLPHNKRPPIAILPLGTGNDLARLHGWGGGYVNESLIQILKHVSEAYVSLLDRWDLKIYKKSNNKLKETKSFFNYLGVGVDAQAALQVHMLRQSKPQLFFSRVINKVWYAVMGAEEAIKESYSNLPQEITLIADGVVVPLPPDSQGIIILNIDSYSGGVPIWSNGVKEHQEPMEFLFRPRHKSMDTLFSYSSSFRGVSQQFREQSSTPRRVQSMGTMNLYHHAASLDRIDSTDDLTTATATTTTVNNNNNNHENETDEEKRLRVTACDRPSSCQDGILEIVSVRGTFHLGQIRVGLGNAQRLCQASSVQVVLKKKVAVQIDGEPWRQGAGTILDVSRKTDPAVLLHRSPVNGVEQEMSQLLDWAQERGLITLPVYAQMRREFSRRMEQVAWRKQEQEQQQQEHYHPYGQQQHPGGGNHVLASIKRVIHSNTTSNRDEGGAFSGQLSF